MYDGDEYIMYMHMTKIISLLSWDTWKKPCNGRQRQFLMFFVIGRLPPKTSQHSVVPPHANPKCLKDTMNNPECVTLEFRFTTFQQTCSMYFHGPSNQLNHEYYCFISNARICYIQRYTYKKTYTHKYIYIYTDVKKINTSVYLYIDIYVHP